MSLTDIHLFTNGNMDSSGDMRVFGFEGTV